MSKLSLRDKNKIKKMYGSSNGRFRKKIRCKQYIRKKDVDEAVYYPNKLKHDKS